uniref:SAM domain-containing protein n=1 Tax=Caenorhabditis japonica TaxID=281687 RepID=A0A8R1DF33_CAEJA
MTCKLHVLISRLNSEQPLGLNAFNASMTLSIETKVLFMSIENCGCGLIRLGILIIRFGNLLIRHIQIELCLSRASRVVCAIDDLEEREEAVASVERVVELLEDHFGFPERTRAPAGQPKLGPTPHFTFEIHGDEPDHWRYVINSIRQEMDREEAAIREARKQDLIAGKPKRSRFTAWFHKRFGTRSSPFAFDNIPYWTSDEVCAWLSSIGMSEYGSTFRKNDIQGSELMHLERSDIMDIGITKIGHVKRLQSAISDLRAHNLRARRAQARKKRVAKEYKTDGSGASAGDKRKESSTERYADGQPSTSSAPSGKYAERSARRIPPKDGESAPAILEKDPPSAD